MGAENEMKKVGEKKSLMHDRGLKEMVLKGACDEIDAAATKKGENFEMGSWVESPLERDLGGGDVCPERDSGGDGCLERDLGGDG